MAPRKPKALINRHDTAAEQQARVDRESAVRPGKALPKDAPAVLEGHEVARSTWRRMIREYNGIEGEIVTRLDMDLLVDYCMLAQQLSEIDMMRHKGYEAWLEIGAAHKKKKDEIKAASSKDMKAILEEEAVMLAIKVVGAFDAIVKLDSRADRKRDLMFKLRQSLYLTPRARAGVAPGKKEEAAPVDPLDELMNSGFSDVNDFLNPGQDGQ